MINQSACSFCQYRMMVTMRDGSVQPRCFEQNPNFLTPGGCFLFVRKCDVEDSVCMDCVHHRFEQGVRNAPPEDCYPDEEWCIEESDNFLTKDGCAQYERRKGDCY